MRRPRRKRRARENNCRPGAVTHGLCGRVAQVAQAPDSAALVKLTALARELGIAIVLGFPERDGSAFFNSAVAIAADGEPAFYRKCHLYGEPERKSFCSGSTVSPIVTVADFRVGMLICYDVEFPEAVRHLAVGGARAVLVPTANMTGFEAVQQFVVRARAYENGCGIVYANYCGADDVFSYSGLSLICGPSGEVLAQAGAADEELLVADLVGESLETFLADRRADLYAS